MIHPPPLPDDRRVTTVNRLKSWMADNGFHHRTIAIDQMPAEGHALRRGPYGWEWLYTERGRDEILTVFGSETEAVRFALERLRHSSTAREHTICFSPAIADRDRVIAELERRGIAHRHDSIPYGGPDDPRYRVFVWGRDYARCTDLSARYALSRR